LDCIILAGHLSKGVQAVEAGTNITITGTATDPIVNASGGGVVSLSGPGLTATPGDLTQSGALTITMPSTEYYALNLQQVGDAYPEVVFSLGAPQELYIGTGTTDSTLGNPVIALINGNTYIECESTGPNNYLILESSAVSITLFNTDAAGTGILFTHNNIGFFGVPTVAQQVSGGTLAGVIAGLVALGLFSS